MSSKHRNTQIRWIIVLLIGILILGLGYVNQEQIVHRYSQIVGRINRLKGMPRTRYGGFGIDMPQGFKVHGIDVSYFQGNINWPLVGAMRSQGKRISFVFMKATEGRVKEDPAFKYNWEGAKSAGLIRGAYHFFHPGVDVKQQAESFYDAVTLSEGDLPPVVDFERGARYLDDNEVYANLMDFVQRLEKHYHCAPIIYTNIKFFNRHLADRELSRYPLWIANYYSDIPHLPGGVKWTLWQHHDGGTVDGIRGPVDFDVFNGSAARFDRLRIH